MANKELREELIKVLVSESEQRIKQSNVYVGLITDNFITDPNCWIELAIAIMNDKPIFAVVKKGTKLPKKLLSVIDKIEYFDNLDESDSRSVTDALERFVYENVILPKLNKTKHEHN